MAALDIQQRRKEARMTPQMMVWQPIVRLHDQALLGYEALARFDGSSPTEVFQSLADDEPAQAALDAQCLHQALGDPPAQGQLFLNVTPATIRRQGWPAIPQELQARVVIELPEGGGWEPPQLPPWGRWALDDVGAGVHELVRLFGVPWTYLKLDRSLITQAANPAIRTLIQALHRQAHQRQGALIAEGIETREQADYAQALGVAYGQGYFLGRPAPRTVALPS